MAVNNDVVLKIIFYAKNFIDFIILSSLCVMTHLIFLHYSFM